MASFSWDHCIQWAILDLSQDAWGRENPEGVGKDRKVSWHPQGQAQGMKGLFVLGSVSLRIFLFYEKTREVKQCKTGKNPKRTPVQGKVTQR